LPRESIFTTLLEVARLTEKAAVRILIYDSQSLLYTIHVWRWWISVPLEVCPHPEEPPPISGPHKSYFREGLMVNNSFVPPVRANLEEFKGVTFNSVSKVNFIAYGWVGTAFRHEAVHRVLNSFKFKIVESHNVSSFVTLNIDQLVVLLESYETFSWISLIDSQ
jgi:hypothetical protein